MIIQVLALLALVLALWTVFRFAMGLRWAKVSREDARAAEQSRGRRVVAEIPLSDDEIVFFVEDEAGFYWGGRQARKRDIRGARLLLNGAVMASFSRDGERLFFVRWWNGSAAHELVSCFVVTWRCRVHLRTVAERCYRAFRLSRGWTARLALLAT